MADVKTEQEPSIEEILESIRQIISDDGAAPAAEAGGELKTAAPPVEPPKTLNMATPEEPKTKGVLSQPPPAPVDTGGEDVLELTDKVESDLVLTAQPEPVDKPGTLDLTEKPMTDNAPSTLMSDQTADAATEAFAKLLAGNIAVEHEVVGRVGKVTLEDIARELMRPMLKSWLDQNLTGIIEKMVQKEIEKLSRRAIDG